MKKEIKDKWVKALRSGKYKQGRFRLCKDNNYCCLGVLVEIAVDQEVCERHFDDGMSAMVYGQNGCKGALPIEVRKWSGIRDGLGLIRSVGYTLSQYNDMEDYTFDQIADIIEEHWEEL